MPLSDEDLAALAHVRNRVINDPEVNIFPDDRAALERVMRLANEPIPEPELGTFWLDPDTGEVYGPSQNDKYRWIKTDSTAYIWDEFGSNARRRLVQLVRKES